MAVPATAPVAQSRKNRWRAAHPARSLEDRPLGAVLGPGPLAVLALMPDHRADPRVLEELGHLALRPGGRPAGCSWRKRPLFASWYR